ncbi:MAG: hypothetical protein ACJ768_09345 [Gaiellaceae bacterium]
MSLPFGLEETVREIVRDELAGRPTGGGDGMSVDGGQQLAADGTVTYDFAGHVHAQGLDLDAANSPGSIADDNRVRWLRQPGGAVAAELVGYDNGGQGVAEMTASEPGAGADITVGSSDGITLFFSQGLGQRLVKLYDFASLSDFVQITDPAGIGADMRVAWGFSTGFWGSNQLNATVAHGLAVTPDVAVAALVLPGSSVFFSTHFVGVSAWDANNVTFTWVADAGVTIAAGQSFFGWLCGVTG